MRRLSVTALVVLIATTAAAQAPGAGRFEIKPESQGFVRLDTRTGATTHCTQHDGAWSCVPVIEDVGALSQAISALGERVDALAGQLEQPDVADGEGRPEDNRGLVAAAVGRLLEFVRVLKHGRSGAA